MAPSAAGCVARQNRKRVLRLSHTKARILVTLEDLKAPDRWQPLNSRSEAVVG